MQRELSSRSKRRPGLEVPPSELRGARSDMNGLTGVVRGATGPAWRDGLELRTAGDSMSRAGSWYSVRTSRRAGPGGVWGQGSRGSGLVFQLCRGGGLGLEEGGPVPLLTCSPCLPHCDLIPGCQDQHRSSLNCGQLLDKVHLAPSYPQ